jgi:hypothetical protein
MFNLLPDELKRKVAREYARRRTIVMLLALIFVLIAGIIGLLPSYLLSLVRHSDAVERTRILGEARKVGDEPDLQAWLSEINQRLGLLSPRLDTDRPSDFIDEILQEKIPGIRLTRFSWTKLEDQITLATSGTALDRVTLITFQNNLNASGHFSEIALPVSNLAQDKDLEFQILFSFASTTPASLTP